MSFHLAQINTARIKAPLDSPIMQEFVRRLPEVNAVADTSPGFVWRLEAEGGSSSYLSPYPDPMIIVNMSVWESVKAFTDYVYRSIHVDAMKQRRDWMDAIERPNVAMWWVPVGYIPSVEEGMHRLEWLRRHGESALAFSVKGASTPVADTSDASIIMRAAEWYEQTVREVASVSAIQ